MTQSLWRDAHTLLWGDLSHEVTHLLNLLGNALTDGDVTEARARFSELRELHGQLTGELSEIVQKGLTTRASPRIKAWVCDECDYWRKEQSSGVHMTGNPANPTGSLARHVLREAAFVEVDRG